MLFLISLLIYLFLYSVFFSVNSIRVRIQGSCHVIGRNKDDKGGLFCICSLSALGYYDKLGEDSGVTGLPARDSITADVWPGNRMHPVTDEQQGTRLETYAWSWD